MYIPKVGLKVLSKLFLKENSLKYLCCTKNIFSPFTSEMMLVDKYT